jgi:ATP-dependent RNA/DNA helicase IGHMBP2
LKRMREAVAEERKDTFESFSARQSLSPAEQRRQGVLLYPLSVRSQQTEGRRTLVSFGTSFPINDTFFRRGCLVSWTQGNVSGEARLTELDERGGVFTVFADEVPDFRDDPVTLRYVPDDRTLQCMELGARLAEEHPQLVKLAESFGNSPSDVSASGFDQLNGSQQRAAAAICGSDPSVLIQGPPGTGKTHTLAAAIARLAKEGRRVILSAPSNTAADNLCHAIYKHGVPFLRVGNEEKMSSLTEQFTIDGYLERGQHKKALEHLRKALRKADEAASRYVRNLTKEAAAERAQARRERSDLRKEIRKMEDDAKKHLLATIPVIAGTPVGLFNELPKEFSVDTVIMDEAGQALEPLTWLTASFGERLVLCGDPMQLPPVVFSQKAKQLGLGRSLLETAMTQESSVLLDQQYRMAPEIVAGINPHFYGNALQTSPDTGNGELLFIDMAGFGEGESRDEISGSIYNADEAGSVKKVLEAFGLSPERTVILSPYSAQLGLLQQTLGNGWRISTIDAVQGQEEDSVVISLTRSNTDGEIGFLKDYRRTNVAISRARKTCIIIGDSSTLGGDAFYGKLIAQLEETGGYRSIWEFAG